MIVILYFYVFKIFNVLKNILFKAIVDSLNLLNDKNASNLLNINKEKHPLAYISCLAHGILQSRQSLVCGGIQKWFSWSTTWITDTLAAIKSFNSADISSFASYLIKVKMIVYQVEYT